MITNQQFVEVLKSLTKEDFDAVVKLLTDFEMFDEMTVKSLFTEDEFNHINDLLESYSNEVRVSVLVCKFKEVFEEELCLQQQ